jgi:protein TonB
VDPTAKPEKGAGNGQPQTVDENNSADSSHNADTNAQAPAESQIQNATTDRAVSENAAATADAPSTPSPQPQANAAVTQTVMPPTRLVASPPRRDSPPPISAASSAGIPSSLKSRIASSTPEASGAKPVEAAMSSIEPVNLPESAARELLAQPVDPEYPATAKSSGQRGSVVLQVIIGRDGAVQDVKFLQGSQVFARTAIDAVKQWRFKPYSLNGRPVAVQTSITLNFKP